MNNEERIESLETPEEESARSGASKAESPAPEPTPSRKRAKIIG